MYIAEHREKIANLATQADAIATYVRCAVNCARSFNQFNLDYRLITNRPDEVAARCAAMGLAVPEMVAYEFSRAIPDDIGFASAHRKLEVIEALGTGELGTRAGIVDLDVELVRPFPDSLNNYGVHALDLTADTLAEFGPRLGTTLGQILGHAPPRAQWWGGEFLVADATQFREISRVIADCWPRYLEMVAGSFHQGDEALTSAALALLGDRSFPVIDAGAEGCVARWWSARTNIPQRRFSQIEGAALFHLPADKPFLAARAGKEIDPARFAADLRRASASKIALRQAASLGQMLTPWRSQVYAPRW